MEELFVYAILCVIGYDQYHAYKNALDRLFMDNPENDTYLGLEGRGYKDAILHTIATMNSYPFNHDVFGKLLMRALKPIYKQSALQDFAEKMYRLWKTLPDSIDYGEQPFYIFCGADDYLSYGDEKQCRELYESAMDYYEQDES